MSLFSEQPNGLMLLLLNKTAVQEPHGLPSLKNKAANYVLYELNLAKILQNQRMAFGTLSVKIKNIYYIQLQQR